MTPLGKIETTSRGFEIIRFKDRYSVECSLQQSSMFDDEHADQLGASAIWLGVDEGANRDLRMHIDLKQAKALVAVLEMWIQFGSFTDNQKHGEKKP